MKAKIKAPKPSKAKQSKQLDAAMLQLDGMNNIISSLVEESEKNKAFGAIENFTFTQNQLDFFYESDPLIRKVCNKSISDMLRQGIDINDDNSDKYYELWDKYKIDNLLGQLGKYNNAFGGAAIVYDVDGLENANLPLDISKVKEINSIFVVDRFFLDPINYKSLKKTESYRLVSSPYSIHESRMSLLTGIDTGIRNRDKNQGWGKSKTELLFNVINNYHIAHNSLAPITLNFYQTIFKLKGFMDLVGTEQEIKLSKRLNYIQKMRSRLHALIIDSEDEFGTKSINLSNLDKVVELIEKALCTMSEYPHTKLLEESPGSAMSNNKDNAQNAQYNDMLTIQQKLLFSDAINKILALFQSVLKLGNKPVKWEFKPLEIMSEKETLALRKDQAETDKINNEIAMSGSPLSEPIIRNRYGSGFYSYETEITPEELSKIKEMKKADNTSKTPNNPKEKVKTA